MHITYKGDYALKTILDLASHYGNSPVSIHDLAGRLDIPVKFLEQILLNLKRGGFVQSRRGKVGGYLLAKSPAAIRLGEVVRFIDGPVAPIACIEKGYSGCADTQGCVLRDVWQRVAEATAKIIDEATFADLLKKKKTSRKVLLYNI